MHWSAAGAPAGTRRRCRPRCRLAASRPTRSRTPRSAWPTRSWPPARHFRRVPHATNGTTVVEGPHLTLSRTPPDVAWGGPTLGQHTEEVLGGLLGYDEDRIAELVLAGALE